MIGISKPAVGSGYSISSETKNDRKRSAISEQSGKEDKGIVHFIMHGIPIDLNFIPIFSSSS